MGRVCILLFAIAAACGGSPQKADMQTTPPPPPAAAAKPHGDAATISLIVQMTIKPEHEQEFLAVCQEFADRVHAEEPGVLLYALTKHPTEPHTYVWLERYKDAATLEAHGNTPEMQAVKPKLAIWLAKPPTVLKLEQLIPR